MRPGTGHVIVGVLLLGAGTIVTLTSEAVVWYGAIIVGLIQIVRGVLVLARGRGDAA